MAPSGVGHHSRTKLQRRRVIDRHLFLQRGERMPERRNAVGRVNESNGDVTPMTLPRAASFL